ncbi:uncharacterized protein LOC117932057 [Vitis riparia]|uniref:uncharacterized protein LOC117932057 n=1 Tax=Vitis riparia TaxID=96939 RepID=UPI00155A0B2F|nr:uncharacterized protein LOC117932057 [Vitis riparia]
MSGHTILRITHQKTLHDYRRLFKWANKYSMLEDDVCAATQQILVTGQPTRNDATRNSKPPSQQRSPNCRQGEQSQSEPPPLPPLTVSYEKLLAMIYELSNFRWPEPLKADPTKRDHNRKYACHKEHGHTTKQCMSLHYLVEKLIRVGHLKQYIRSRAKGGETSRSQAFGAPSAPITPNAVINYIHSGHLDEEYNSKRKRQRLLQAASVRKHINSIRPGLTSGSSHPIDGTIIFPPVDPIRILQPHRDALILSLGIGDFDVRLILVYPGSSVDLLQVSVIKQMGLMSCILENSGRILSGFNRAATTSLEDVVLLVQASPVILNIQFSVVEDLSPFNAILGRT